MPATATIAYRKTKAGQWVAYGPAAILRPGEVVVTKRDGSTKVELVERLGRPFEVDGVEMVYGYLATRAPRGFQPAGGGGCTGRMDCHCETCE